MIAQLVKMLAVIFKLKVSKRYDDALREIDQVMRKLCGMNSQLVNALSEESLVATLRGGAKLDVGKTLVIAELLKQEADVLHEQGNEEGSVQRYAKALRLFLEALREADYAELPEYSPKFDELFLALDGYVLSSETSRLLVGFFVHYGQFDDAEDVLSDLLEDEENSEDALAFARDFYTRLAEKTDDELEMGGLPRDEIDDALARLEGE